MTTVEESGKLTWLRMDDATMRGTRTVALIMTDTPRSNCARRLEHVLRKCLGISTRILSLPTDRNKYAVMNETDSHLLVFVLGHGGTDQQGRAYVWNREGSRVFLDGNAFEHQVQRLTMFASICVGGDDCPARVEAASPPTETESRPPWRSQRAYFVHRQLVCTNLHAWRSYFIQSVIKGLTEKTAPQLIDVVSLTGQILPENGDPPPQLITNQDPTLPVTQPLRQRERDQLWNRLSEAPRIIV